MNSPMKTCGELYLKALEMVKHCHGDKISIGFLIGQAEKVFLGACNGCMTKDSEIGLAAQGISVVYQLKMSVLMPDHDHVRSTEIWIHRGPLAFTQFEMDSPEWNLQRAALCGVPAKDIDLNYHAAARLGNY